MLQGHGVKEDIGVRADHDVGLAFLYQVIDNLGLPRTLRHALPLQMGHLLGHFSQNSLCAIVT